MGEFISAVLRKMAKVPVGRFVDDFYGCSALGLRWTGAKVMRLLCTLLGTRVDPKKSLDEVWDIVLLGGQLSVDSAKRSLKHRITQDKIEQWTAQLQEAVRTWRLPAGEAAKVAGRLNFACCVHMGKEGRAFIIPVYRQAHEPYRKITILLREALMWWCQYLQTVAPLWRPIDWAPRPHRVAWTDAASGTGILRASSKAVDTNLLIGKLWMQLAQMRTAVDWRRVVSKSNPADAPSRLGDCREWANRHGAIWKEPRLPTFCYSLYHLPEAYGMA